MKTVRASEFATVIGIADRTAREVFRQCTLGKTWRNISLPMIELEGEAGGVSGKLRCIVVDALPPELRAKFEPPSKAIETPLQTLFEEGKTDDASALACWRWSSIRDVYGMPIGPDKTAEIARITSQTHHFRGRDTTVATSTIYDWLKRYADGGFGALACDARADRGKRRVLTSRNWDNKVDLDDDAKERVFEAMERYAKAFIRSDGSLRKLAHIGSRKLVELCQSEGSNLAAPALSSLCKLNAKRTSRFNEFKRIARKDRDAKLHFDKSQPRVGRRYYFVRDVAFARVMWLIAFMT